MTTPTFQQQRLAELRYTTQQFINDAPTTVTLLPSRGNKVAKPSGGHDYTPATPRAPQTFRLSARGIDSHTGGVERSARDQGKVVTFMYDLIGRWDATIEIGDTWDETAPDGSAIHYHVDSVQPFNGYSTIAVVTAFATEPQHGDA